MLFVRQNSYVIDSQVLCRFLHLGTNETVTEYDERFLEGKRRFYEYLDVVDRYSSKCSLLNY